MSEQRQRDAGIRMKQKPVNDLAASVTELATILGVCRSTAYRAVQTGQIPSVRIGRRYLIPRNVINEMMDTLENAKPTEALAMPVQAPSHQRVVRGGARLSQQQFEELTETVDALSDVLRDIGDFVMRLRRVRDDLMRAT